MLQYQAMPSDVPSDAPCNKIPLLGVCAGFIFCGLALTVCKVFQGGSSCGDKKSPMRPEKTEGRQGGPPLSRLALLRSTDPSKA